MNELHHFDASDSEAPFTEGKPTKSGPIDQDAYVAGHPSWRGCWQTFPSNDGKNHLDRMRVHSLRSFYVHLVELRDADSNARCTSALTL
jgi:hypothetical protein